MSLMVGYFENRIEYGDENSIVFYEKDNRHIQDYHGEIENATCYDRK